MTSPSDTVSTETEARPLAARVIAWHWRWPFFLASALLLILLGAVFGIHSMIGESSTAEGHLGHVGIEIHVRADIVFSIVSAYTFGAGLSVIAMATRELDRMRSMFRGGNREFAEIRARLFPDLRALTIAFSIGGAFGLTLGLLPHVFSGSHISAHGQHVSLHSIPLVVLLFGLLGTMALITVRQSRVFHEVGRQHIEVNLLNDGELSPFAGVGLMNAAAWFIGSALASLLMVSAANPLIVGLVIVATTGLGIAALIVPSRGLHLRIRELKREELTQIRTAIASERTVLFSADESSPLPPRMHAMLSYEARIEGVREWPFDTSTLGRFGFFLLIPLVSWIGGALVERAVNAALG